MVEKIENQTGCVSPGRRDQNGSSVPRASGGTRLGDGAGLGFRVGIVWFKCYRIIAVGLGLVSGSPSGLDSSAAWWLRLKVARPSAL